jgi:hypothetical protein
MRSPDRDSMHDFYYRHRHLAIATDPDGSGRMLKYRLEVEEMDKRSAATYFCRGQDKPDHHRLSSHQQNPIYRQSNKNNPVGRKSKPL